MAETSEHRQERQDDEAIEHVSPLLEPVVVDQCNDHHDDDTDH